MRRQLEESPLADLHALASELGIEGYRRLRREDLIGAIVASQGGDTAEGDTASAAAEAERAPARPRRGRGRSPRRRRSEDERTEAEEGTADEDAGDAELADEETETRTGTLDVLPNGSGFVRADPFAHSPDDVYVSPAQIRRCELRTADEVSGPVRPPRRSERYPSLVRVETVNGAPAEPPVERPVFADLTPVFARVRLAAPDELSDTPFGRGSRVAVAGPPGAGATALLRRIVSTLSESNPEVETTVVLAGVRPEEIAEWRSEVGVRVVGGSFDGSAERQGETASMAIERAKRAAERGNDAVVVVDSLEQLPAAASRRVFGAARNTEEAGSVTVIAATGIGPEPARHATTRIVLRPPSDAGTIQVDADVSGASRAELLS